MYEIINQDGYIEVAFNKMIKSVDVVPLVEKLKSYEANPIIIDFSKIILDNHGFAILECIHCTVYGCIFLVEEQTYIEILLNYRELIKDSFNKKDELLEHVYHLNQNNKR